MTELLNDMETALTDLLQSGLATTWSGEVFGKLAASCEARGLHTGAALMALIQAGLDQRAHTMEKEDMTLTEDVCAAVRYITLCREKCQEQRILTRWQEEGGTL